MFVVTFNTISVIICNGGHFIGGEKTRTHNAQDNGKPYQIKLCRIHLVICGNQTLTKGTFILFKSETCGKYKD